MNQVGFVLILFCFFNDIGIPEGFDPTGLIGGANLGRILNKSYGERTMPHATPLTPTWVGFYLILLGPIQSFFFRVSSARFKRISSSSSTWK